MPPDSSSLLNTVCVCLYSFLSYPARRADIFCAELYSRLWCVRLCHIFPHYLINSKIFGGKVERKMWVFISSTTSICYISYSGRIWQDILTNVHKYSRKVHVVLVIPAWILKFPHRFSNSLKISLFMKIRPVGGPLFQEYRRMDGRTDTTKLVIAFGNFANDIKKIKQ
jgi:hypothetical protein